MFCFNNRHVCLHLITLQVNILINTCFYLPEPEIKVTEGSDVTLPCNITEDITKKSFEWKTDDQKEVFMYDNGSYSSQDLSGQSDQFKGRVSHFPGELKNGDASIMIRNTKVADSGDYTCEFKHLSNQRFLMRLLVDETGLRVPHGLSSNSQNTHLAGPCPHSAAVTSGLIPFVSNVQYL
uniref:Ig-like domain-containing protein n=1 Tax=Seriola lalandi dorsalis TaxID=1841481 RepID=A0A3B4WU45_SERLL